MTEEDEAVEGLQFVTFDRYRSSFWAARARAEQRQVDCDLVGVDRRAYSYSRHILGETAFLTVCGHEVAKPFQFLAMWPHDHDHVNVYGEVPHIFGACVWTRVPK